MEQTIIGQELALAFTKLAHAIEPALLKFLALLFIAAVMFTILRVIISNLTNYLFYRWDQYLGIGTPIVLNGYVGRVKKLTLFYLLIETKHGYVRIPMSKWRDKNILVLKTTVDPKTLKNKTKC